MSHVESKQMLHRQYPIVGAKTKEFRDKEEAELDETLPEGRAVPLPAEAQKECEQGS